MPKRLMGILAATVILFVGLFGRLYGLSVSSLKTASLQQSTRTQTLYTARGTVYDRYLRPLVNADTAWAVSLYPYDDSLLHSNAMPFTSQERKAVREAMERGHRALLLREEALPFHAAVTQAEVPIRYKRQPTAVHLIGYVNGENQGVCGIERGYDDVLQSFEGEWRISYAIDALGRPASKGIERDLNTITRSQGGVVLTIDSQIQIAAEEALCSMVDAGAIIVSDVHSGQVLAMAGFPSYDPNEVEVFLKQKNAPLMDRTLCLYNVGSVFKTLVAAAALENGLDENTTFSCCGSISVNGVTFGCRDHGGKTTLTMREALACSCNTYFIQLAQAIGASAVEEMALLARWNLPLTMAKGIQTSTPTFPSSAELATSAALANTAIGQGQILASAFHVHTLMCAVARGGEWIEPTVYLGAVDAAGVVDESDHQPQTEVLMSESTARILQTMLADVVASGTGNAAAPKNGTAFGKTGTAESGWTVAGEEVVQSWFSGCYPAHQPQYVITVLSENGGSNGKTAAPVFATICDALFEAGLVEFSQEMY